MTEALLQAKEGRAYILGEMMKTMDQPREDYKDHAPWTVSFGGSAEAIGPIIGPGGKIINEIQDTTGANVSIEDADGKGIVEVSGDNKQKIDAAVARIRAIAFPPTVEVGEITKDRSRRSCLTAPSWNHPGQDGLLHLRLEHHREQVSDVINEGDIVKFKVTGRDPRSGKLKLSRKVLLPKPE